MASTAWRKDRITDREDDATGLKIVELPTVKGMTKAVRDAVFAFEREHLGTVRAVIRMNKRAQGTDVPIPARLASVTPPAAIAHLYQ
jgi:hypothetical protein